MNAEGDDSYAERVLRPFMNKAYRRVSTDDELSEMMNIYRQEKKKGLPLKQALRMPLATILTSPKFLFIADQETASNAKSAETGQWFRTGLASVLLSLAKHARRGAICESRIGCSAST